ncbi:MAG TPA: mechanosensitive ion channel family protein [Pyrinomonadaceae bacterium]|nr:mechanosensitive ion channel family protein [Pyrinomonadaceae bacterium]
MCPDEQPEQFETSAPSANRDAEVERLKQRSDIKKALQQTAGAPVTSAPTVEKKQKFFLGTYLLLLIILAGLYYLLRLQWFGIAPAWLSFLQRADLGAIGIATVIASAKTIDVYLVDRVSDPVAEYNIRRILKLIATFAILLIAISVLFVNWYAAVVSLGVISVIVGLALQTTFTSFIGWIYILVRAPYRVGDRIRIGDATGDVIDVSYLDTTLWEFGGDLLSTDHPSGRVIRFPNSNVLSSPVYNYSWPVFPYIWNEIKFNIAYESDLEFVASTMQDIAEEELGEAMLKRVQTFTRLLAETPVDQLEVRERPNVIFRVNSNTWLDATVRYLVPPREAGRIKTRLIKKMLARLNAEPDRTMFPKGSAR